MGEINLDNTGSGSSVTLSSDGTNLLLNGSSVSGGTTDSTKMPLAGGTFSGDVTFSTGKIIAPTNASGLGMDIEIPSVYGLDVIYTGNNPNEFLARFGSNGAVQLYHNGTEKFATSSSGATVTGTLAATAITGDGSGLTNLPSSGGGGAALYAANESSPSAQPSATGNNAIAMGEEAVASGNFSMAIGPDYVAAVSRAIAIGMSRSGGDNELAVGIMNITSSYGAIGDQSFAQNDRAKASGMQSFSAGKQSTASGSRSVALGYQASASGQNAMAFGYSANAQGSNNIAMGDGASTPSWASNSTAIGKNCKTNAKGKIAFGAQAGGIGLGLAQSGMLVIHGRTANSTSSVLTSDGGLQGLGTAAYNNQLYLESYAAMAFDGMIVARGQGSASDTNSAAWKIEGLIRREANANTTVLVNSATTVISNAPSWGLSLSADTTNGCLSVNVTGASSSNVKWVCTLRTSETIYDSY
jgi:hypothetical protein